MTIERNVLGHVTGGVDWMTTTEKAFQWGASGAMIGAAALPVFPPISSPVGGAIGAVVGAGAGLGFGTYATWNQTTRKP